MVKIRIYGVLRVLAGRNELDVDAENVREACKKLTYILGDEARKLVFNERGEVYPSILIFKDNDRVTNLSVQVKQDDTLYIIPAVEGGVK